MTNNFGLAQEVDDVLRDGKRGSHLRVGPISCCELFSDRISPQVALTLNGLLADREDRGKFSE